MERLPFIPFSLIRDLRCKNCQNVVNCGPVYVLPDENILCGRCHQLAKDIFPNISFEALSTMFFYPCQHWEDHCPKILQWNESFNHENGCSYNSGCKLFWKHPKAFLKGKRDMPRGDIRLIPVPESLLDYIKCLSCEGYLSCEPVYIRADGKSICHRCIHSNGIPADCLRNVAYEILSSIIIFPCVFRNRGCPTRLKFGTDLWHHEAECSYNHMYRKIEKKASQKERGVIKTHSGHVYEMSKLVVCPDGDDWYQMLKSNNRIAAVSDFCPQYPMTGLRRATGTITPFSAPFAPPSLSSEYDINKALMKSLKSKQDRKLMRAEEITSNFNRTNSDDNSREVSVDEESEKANSFDKSLSNESNTSTPTPPSISGEDSLKVQAPVYFNYENNNNYYENMNLFQQQNNETAKEVPNSPLTKYPPPLFRLDDEIYENIPRVSRMSSYNNNSVQYENALNRNSSMINHPLKEVEYSILAGQYPVYTNSYGQGLIPKPSFKGVVRTDSISSNRELIQELKLKQQQRNKSKEQKEKETSPSPYQECNNLEEIIQVHDKISE